MLNQINLLLGDTTGLVAQGACLLWRPALVWIHAIPDVVIGLAYLTIVLVLGNFGYRRPGIPFLPLLSLMAGFTALCGLSYWLDALTVWYPAYHIQGAAKVITALLAIATAITLWRQLPRVKAMAAASGVQFGETKEALRKTEDMLERIGSAQRGRDRFRAAIQAVQGVLWTNDADGRMVGEQPAWAALTGQTFKEYQGYGWADAVHPEDAQATVVAWNQAVAERRTFVFEHRVRRHDGVWRTFAIRGEPLLAPDRDTILEWVGVHTDITEQRLAKAALQRSNIELENRVAARTAQLERMTRHLAKAKDKAEKANRAKSRFLAGMSHELRTPLTGILGYVEMLRMDGGLNTTQEDRLNAMLDAGKHLLQMITCVLDLSEIEAEHVVLQPVELSVEAVSKACLDLIRPMAEAKALTLSIIIPAETSPKLVADPTRLRQVLLNLLGNAAKFTSQGAITLRIRTMTNGPMLRIEIADTGLSIPAEQRQRLFQDFERLDTDSSRTTEGAGLGLALSARLAVLMGGRLGYDENPGGGNVFWLDLPLNVTAAPSVRPAPATDKRNAQAPPRSMRALNVLVVDDVFMNRDIAQAFLEAAGHTVTCAESGIDAVALASSIDFDLVLMDVRMPQMDGLEATRRIRALESARCQVPIVALTAHAFTEQVEACRKAGMDSHLSKPFDLTTLLTAVENAISTRHPLGPKPESVNVGQEPAAALSCQPSLVLNEATFKSTTCSLPPDMVATHLRTITRLGESLLDSLMVRDVPTDTAFDSVADAAHNLAGSAGMFGFERLAAAGYDFEQAFKSAGPGKSVNANELFAAVVVTLKQLRKADAAVNN